MIMAGTHVYSIGRRNLIILFSLILPNLHFLFLSGMLLRWFVNLYDLEIVEEDAFLTWKEDLSQDYPGKGKALFQVSIW